MLGANVWFDMARIIDDMMRTGEIRTRRQENIDEDSMIRDKSNVIDLTEEDYTIVDEKAQP